MIKKAQINKKEEKEKLNGKGGSSTMMDFLNLPEDKLEYISAFLSLTPFVLGPIFTFWWLIRLSRKEQVRFDSSPYASLVEEANRASGTAQENQQKKDEKYQ